MASRIFFRALVAIVFLRPSATRLVSASRRRGATLWGFVNLTVGFILLGSFAPQGSAAGWILTALGVLLAAIWLSTYFGRLRWRQARKLPQRPRGFDPLSPS
jgi:hypothetical protein